MDSTSRNVALGLGASINGDTSAVANVAIGNAALHSNIKGKFTTAIGDSAGYSIDSFPEAVFVGNKAGRGRIFNVGLFTVAVGSHAGDSNVVGWETLVGNYAGVRNRAIGNTMIGSEAGRNNQSGFVTYVGDNAGRSNVSGTSHVFIGTRAGALNVDASGTTAIGYESAMNSNAFEGVFIGNLAGRGLVQNFASFGTIIGSHAGDSAAAAWSTIVGNFAGRVNQINGNTMMGSESGRHNTTGTVTFFGDNSGWSNTTGNLNTFLGTRAARQNTTGSDNTAVGYEAMKNSITGGFNTAMGVSALLNDSLGMRNTAIGALSQFSNSGNDNTSLGYETLILNTTGFHNVAVGGDAQRNTVNGIFNTAVGDSALYNDFGGSSFFNTTIGGRSLMRTTNSFQNTVVGYSAASQFDLGPNNVFIGANADASAPGITNSVAIGTNAIITANNQVRIGNNLTNSIGGFASWTSFSDGRFKKNIQEDVKGIDFIMKLRPVTYQLDLDGINRKIAERTGVARTALTQNGNDVKRKEVISGFVAQEVEQAAMETGYEFSGVDKPGNENDFYGLRYSDFVAPLVKAVQELVKRNEQLQMNNNMLKSQYDELLKRIEKLESDNKKSPSKQ